MLTRRHGYGDLYSVSRSIARVDSPDIGTRPIGRVFAAPLTVNVDMDLYRIPRIGIDRPTSDLDTRRQTEHRLDVAEGIACACPVPAESGKAPDVTAETVHIDISDDPGDRTR